MRAPSGGSRGRRREDLEVELFVELMELTLSGVCEELGGEARENAEIA
jgi:hypothetical protein